LGGIAALAVILAIADARAATRRATTTTTTATAAALTIIDQTEILFSRMVHSLPAALPRRSAPSLPFVAPGFRGPGVRAVT